MVDLLERIGPYLGIAAFLGLSILAFLIIQQAREVRRLREWAGRAPERADEAAEASAAAAEARGETIEPEEEEEEDREPGRFAAWRGRVAERFRAGYAAVDRRMPIDLRYLLALLAAGAVAAAVLTSGFGLIGDGGGGEKRAGKQDGKPDKIEVAVLNATQEEGTVSGQPIAGVRGLAGLVADEVVKPAGYKAGAEENAASGLDQTTVFFDTGEEEAADELAEAVADELGETPVAPMIEEVRDRAAKAPLALVVGRDDAEFSAAGSSDGEG